MGSDTQVNCTDFIIRHRPAITSLNLANLPVEQLLLDLQDLTRYATCFCRFLQPRCDADTRSKRKPHEQGETALIKKKAGTQSRGVGGGKTLNDGNIFESG